MGSKKLFYSIFGAAAIGFLSTGCGGSSGAKTVDLTVSVPTAGSAKKGKHHKEVSVTDVKGVLLSDGTEVEGTEDADGNFTVKVPEGSDVRILATVTNENGSEFTFESFVNDATESDQVVDEDSTRIASLIVGEGESNDTSLKDLLAQEEDVTKEMNDLLASFNNRDYLNEILASSNSEESLDAIKDKIEEAIKKLKRISRLLAKFEERLSQFEDGTEVVKFEALTEDDVKDDNEDESDENDGDFVSGFVVRPGNISSIAIGEHSPESDLDLSLNDDGSISVERGDEVSTTDAIISRGGISGRFVSGRTDGLTIGVKREGVITNVDFSFSAELTDLTALVKSFAVDDRLSVTFTEVDGKKIVKAIYAEGYLSGTLTALTKTSATITLADGTTVEMLIKVEKVIKPLPQETVQKKFLEGVAIDDEVEETVETTSEVEENDLSTLSELEDNNEFEVDSGDVAIGDMVIIHWQIVDNVKVAAGIFPDKEESFDDPIQRIDGTRPTLIGEEGVDEGGLEDDGKAIEPK